MDKAKRKHLFQIRKVPLKPFVPQKTPQLYALDVHSICLPIRKKKSLNWASLHYDESNHFEDEFNEQIIYSQAYQQLYSQYLRIKEECSREKRQIQIELDGVDDSLDKMKTEKRRLVGMRDGLNSEIQGLRDRLTEVRDNNYNLRWELYPQTGAYVANLHGYSFLQPNEMTYEQLLQMEEQMGSVSKGLTPEQIEQLSKQLYVPPKQQLQKQICCVCFDQIQQGEQVIVLKCRHTHHCDCIRDWLFKQKVCPICKKEVLIAGDQAQK